MDITALDTPSDCSFFIRFVKNNKQYNILSHDFSSLDNATKRWARSGDLKTLLAVYRCLISSWISKCGEERARFRGWFQESLEQGYFRLDTARKLFQFLENHLDFLVTLSVAFNDLTQCNKRIDREWWSAEYVKSWHSLLLLVEGEL